MKNTTHKKSEEDKDKVIDTLYSELKRKDELIAKLKEENIVLMKTALKVSEKKLEKK